MNSRSYINHTLVPLADRHNNGAKLCLDPPNSTTDFKVSKHTNIFSTDLPKRQTLEKVQIQKGFALECCSIMLALDRLCCA